MENIIFRRNIYPTR